MSKKVKIQEMQHQDEIHTFKKQKNQFKKPSFLNADILETKKVPLATDDNEPYHDMKI